MKTRSHLSPFPESAIGSLLSEIIQGSRNKVSSLRALRRVKAMVAARIVEIETAPAKKKKRRKHSPEEQAKRDAWFAEHRRDRIDEPQPRAEVAITHNSDPEPPVGSAERSGWIQRELARRQERAGLPFMSQNGQDRLVQESGDS